MLAPRRPSLLRSMDADAFSRPQYLDIAEIETTVAAIEAEREAKEAEKKRPGAATASS